MPTNVQHKFFFSLVLGKYSS